MALIKPLMVMGGSLHETARSPSRASLRAHLEQMTTNTFSSVMEAQGRPAAPEAPLQAVRTRTLASLARTMDKTGDPMQDAMLSQSMNTMMGALNQEITRRPSQYSKNSANILGELGKKRDVLPATGAVAKLVRSSIQKRQDLDTGQLGNLSARFESGKDIAAIGYDRVGGTSYGKYQIASKPGSMKRFIQFLDKEAPDISQKLKNAGPSNTGGRMGKMPEVWKQLAEKEPERFASLQESFIHDTHYAPALDAVQKAGFKTEDFSPALKEVLWSTSVQHGPASAAKIFIRAAEKAGGDDGSDNDLIKNVYASRSRQFKSSTDAVRTSVQNRLREEQNIALAMSDRAVRAG